MATGFCPALLHHIDDIADGNAPGNKLHIAGFLAMLFCCQNSAVSPLNDAYDGGHLRPMTVKYRKRPTLDQVQTEDDCDINKLPAYLEWTVSALGHAQHSQFIDDATIAQYCRDASSPTRVGPTTVMNEVYSLIVESANVVMRYVNKSLVTQMATQFGENVTTNSNAGKIINISKNSSDFVLDNGIVDMMRDLQENEICDEPCIVGGGLFAAFDQARALACCNASGIDYSRTGIPNFYFDKDTQTQWGPNVIGVFAKGSVKFLSRMKYTGAFGGHKGTSDFFTMALPIKEFGCNIDQCLSDLMFDVQIRYIDCPTTLTLNGVTGTYNRGWLIIVSKEYGLWVQPTSAYETTDELEETNGTLKYFIRNTSYTGSSYAYNGYN